MEKKKKPASKKRFTFADAKAKIQDLEDKLALAIEVMDSNADRIAKRTTKRDYYQGAAAGAIVTAVIFIVLIIIF